MTECLMALRGRDDVRVCEKMSPEACLFVLCEVMSFVATRLYGSEDHCN